MNLKTFLKYDRDYRDTLAIFFYSLNKYIKLENKKKTKQNI